MQFGKLPSNVVELVKRAGWFLVFMQITRVLFFLFNKTTFQSFTFSDFIGGLWFDIVTFHLIGFPYIILHSLPFRFRFTKAFQVFLNSLYYIIFISCLSLNLIDVIYYKHSHKRSTIDLFSIVSTGNDFQQQLSSLFRDFWFLLLFMLIFLGIFIFIHKKTFKRPVFTTYKAEILSFLIITGCTIALGRGGFSLRPISTLNASFFTSSDKIGLVLNTPFTVIKSIGKQQLEVPEYYTPEELPEHFNPIQTSQPQHLFSQQKNVVIILLESFGAEFVGCAGAKRSFTPFLDSIAQHSLNFKNGVANGSRSIEAMPAIYVSIPTWMDEAYITSPYGSNNVRSIAQILGSNGYETAFFHGATNGSMRFDAFTKQMGVTHYFGRNEYGNDAHFDKSWGILDEYFLPWSVKKMNDLKKPFFSTIFTLSSHHPYYIPKNWKGKLKKGPHPLCETINYTDESLRLFFKEAKKQDWYKNTLFIFLADHTPAAVSSKYASHTEIFHIPILIFDPEQKVKPANSDEFFQQTDLYPTLLDLLDIKTDFYAFGNSYFKHRNEAMSYAQGNYFYFFENYILTFQDNECRNLINIKTPGTVLADSLSSYQNKSQAVSKRIRAMIQTFNSDLLHNQANTNKR